LHRLPKQDLLKFLIKQIVGYQGLDHAQPRLKLARYWKEKLSQKHDTSKDENIVQEIYKQIDVKNNEIHEITREVYHLVSEVKNQ
jgi:hypothetical protein